MITKSFLAAVSIGGLLCFLLNSCNSGSQTQTPAVKKDTVTKTDTMVLSPGKGIGRFNEVKLNHPLDKEMATKGQALYQVKCFACHKLTDEKLVGPGWKGVTDRRTPEWIMNFATNTQVMLDKDIVAEQLMVTCVVRMPNQDLTDDQARQILEFMLSNDGKN